jgi:hypothetical protein
MINDPVSFVFKFSGNNYLSIDSNAEVDNTRTSGYRLQPQVSSGNVFSSNEFRYILTAVVI